MSTAASETEDSSEQSVKDRLQADILAQKFRPGEWLKQVDLERAYNANRFEVRIALSQMAERHLIDHIPNRGYRVIDPTDRERVDLYEVRTILETGAARLVTQRASDEDIAELSAMVDEFATGIDHMTTQELQRLNMEFHNRFYQICGNPLLAEQIQELRERGLPGRSGGWDAIAGRRASCDDHARMIEMLQTKDADGLCYVVYHHLNRWREFSRPDSD